MAQKYRQTDLTFRSLCIHLSYEILLYMGLTTPGMLFRSDRSFGRGNLECEFRTPSLCPLEHSGKKASETVPSFSSVF